jgi:hypothetical protein
LERRLCTFLFVNFVKSFFFIICYDHLRTAHPLIT